MKKAIISVLAAFAIAQAGPLPYKVFVESYSMPNNPDAEKTYNEVAEILKKYPNAKVLKRQSGDYHVVVVEAIMEKDELKKMYDEIKSIPEHEDAFYLPAPEILDQEVAQETSKQAEFVEDKLDDVVLAEPEANITVEEDVQMSEDEVVVEQREAMDEEEPKNVLTLQQAVEQTLAKNPKLKKRIFSYMEIGNELDIAHRRYYPTLDLSAHIGMGRDRVEMGDWEKGSNRQIELKFVQNLYDGGSTVNRKEQAISRMENASFLVLETADRTTLSMVDAYLNLLKERKLLALAEENKEHIEKIYKKIKERTESGFGRKSEKQQAASRYTLAQSNFIAQQNAYNDALTTFQKISGYDASEQELMSPQFPYALPEDFEQIEKVAYKCNPSLRAQGSNIQLAQNILDNADALFLPKLDLEAFARYKDTLGYGGIRNDNRLDSYGALLRLKYNLFNGGIDVKKREKSKVGIQKEQEIFDGLRDDLKESLRFSWQSYKLNLKKIGFIKEHAKYSNETLQAYKEEFNIGRRELINVLDAENEYFTAQKEIATTRKDLLYSKYRILDNMGLLTDSFKPGFGQKYVKNACSIKLDEN